MQPYQRRNFLSAALNLQPGNDPTRDTVEAAIWAALGPLGDESRVSLLLSVIDAYSDARSRRAAVGWARQTGGELPPLGTDLAQTAAVRRSLESLSRLPRTLTATAATARRPQFNRTDVPFQLPSQPQFQPRPHLAVAPAATGEPPAIITDDAWQAITAEFSVTGVQPEEPVSSNNEHDADGNELFSCSTCPPGRNLHPRSEFYKSSSNKRGFDYACKKCKGQKNKEWRDAKKKRQREEAAAVTASEAEMDEQAEVLIDHLLSS
jgi:hypothetical protein